MVHERPKQFGGTVRYNAALPQPRLARPHPLSSTAASASASASASRPAFVSSSAPRGAPLMGLGKGSGGLGKGVGGLGKGVGGNVKGMKRHMKIQRDTIYGVTQGDIRRLARRGGVKRISAVVYDEIRQTLKWKLTTIMKEVIAIVELAGRKTVTVSDIIFILNRQGRPLYGFDPSFN